MDSVVLSPKFQVVIPRRIRDAMNLVPGQKMQVVEHGSRIELVPIRKMSELRGIAKGINTNFTRENDRV